MSLTCKKNKKEISNIVFGSYLEPFPSNSQYLSATQAWEQKPEILYAKHENCLSWPHKSYIWMISKRAPIKSYKHAFGMRTNTIKSASWVY